jgi:tRNA-specific 2-thiouridylase
VRGEHEGLHLYTIGQRKGINIGGDGPYYVFAKDRKRNVIRISNDLSKTRLESWKFGVEKVSWINGKPKLPIGTLVKSRYQEKADSAIIKKHGKVIEVCLKKPKMSITPGQSAVFYAKSGQILGGGIIK